MSHRFVDQMLEKSKAGELRSPVSETLGMHLVAFGRGEAVYVRAARRQGATEEEIREVLRQVAVYAGFPSAWNALATMKQSTEGVL